MRFFNRVRQFTPTIGTGTTITLGSAVSPAHVTLAEAGAQSGDQTVVLVEQDDDYALYVVTVNAGAGSVGIATVIESKIAGVRGTDRLPLGGTASLAVCVPDQVYGAFVRSDVAQSLTAQQQAQARSNMGMAAGWGALPLFVPVPVLTHLHSSVAAALPPIGAGLPRYVVLEAGLNGPGGYNQSVLISESVTGSGALVLATAVVNLPASPAHGKTVRLLGTEGRVLRAGTFAMSGDAEADQMQRIQGWFGYLMMANEYGIGGAFEGGSTSMPSYYGPGAASSGYWFGIDTALVARTGNETRAKNMRVPMVMRIL